MSKSTPIFEVIKFSIWFFGLIIFAIIFDYILHSFNLVWIGRYLGIFGSILLLSSFVYSFRKRKKIQFGNLKSHLLYHEISSWLGALMILLHGGIHFSAILPWLALTFMIINVASGFVGRYLVKKSTSLLEDKKRQLKEQGLTKDEIDNEILWESIATNMMKKWRLIHFPISTMFLILALIHIVSIFIFWHGV